MEVKKSKRYRRRELRQCDLKFIFDFASNALRIDGIEKSELPDIKQELALALVNKMHLYNPTVETWARFRTLIVHHALADYLRKRIGPESYFKRNAPFSLDDPAPGSHPFNPLFYRDMVNSDGVFADGTERSEAERMDTVIDVRAAIASMPKHLQRICRAIMNGENKTALSKRFHISRPTLDVRFLEIKKVLISHGF